MTQHSPIRPPSIDDETNDWSDCDRFLDECVNALMGVIGPEIVDIDMNADEVAAETYRTVVGMLERKAAGLKRRGRPPGRRNKNRSPAGSASTIARRKREERQRVELERWQARRIEETVRFWDRLAALDK